LVAARFQIPSSGLAMLRFKNGDDTRRRERLERATDGILKKMRVDTRKRHRRELAKTLDENELAAFDAAAARALDPALTTWAEQLAASISALLLEGLELEDKGQLPTTGLPPLPTLSAVKSFTAPLAGGVLTPTASPAAPALQLIAEVVAELLGRAAEQIRVALDHERSRHERLAARSALNEMAAAAFAPHPQTTSTTARPETDDAC